LRADAATNTLVVGPRGSLACSAVEVRGALYAPAEHVQAKLRYRSPAVPARVTPTADGFTLELEQPAYGVAPGQIAALYDDGAVVGCGVVSSATGV
jgi:tRNA-specific 2-thiouridylase